MRVLMVVLMMGTVLGVLTVPAHAVNILGNAGFETGSLSPWFQGISFDVCGSSACEDWNVTSADAHSGTFSATDVGNKELRQNFSPVATSSINEVSFWMKHPALNTPTAVTFHYSDNTPSIDHVLITSDANWDFFNATSLLDPNRNLTGISISGFSGGPGPTERTFLDDVVIDSSAVSAVPEPSTFALAVIGMFVTLGYSQRWARTATTKRT